MNMRTGSCRMAIAAIAVLLLLDTACLPAAASMVLLDDNAFHARQGWYAGADIPIAVNRAAATDIEETIYVVGGLDDSGHPIDALQAYSPSANIWVSKASLPETLYEGDGAVTLQNKIYLPGGWNGSLPLDTLYVYDPATDHWSSKASMPHLSGCGMSGKIDGKLYVTTACDGFSGYRKDLDVYDPATDRWKSLKPSLKAHGEGAGAVIDDKFYVAGGTSDLGISRVAEVYDPVTDSWTELANMPHAVAGPAGVALRGLFVVIGGTNDSGDAIRLQVYNPVTNVWQTMSPKLPAAQNYAAFANAYGRPFVIGGVSGGASTAANLNLAIVTPIP